MAMSALRRRSPEPGPRSESRSRTWRSQSARSASSSAAVSQRAGDLLLDPARREFLSRNRMMPAERVEILQGTLGAQAGAIGAALWAARAV